MNILIASSQEHVKYFTVMLESLFVNHPDEQIDVYVIHDSASHMDWSPLREQAERYGNRIVPVAVEEKQFSKFPRVSPNWPRLLYFKLLAAELLPAHLDRVLLLESDMIITKSLAPLYHMDFNGKHIIACKSLSQYWGNVERFQGKAQRRLKLNLGIPDECDLFGGGVVVQNLVKIREDGIGFDTLTGLAERYRYSWGAPEESLFWALYYNSVKYADPWSYYLLPVYWKEKSGPIEDKFNPYGSILHYSLCNRPWDCFVLDKPSELDRIWWSYAEKTVFYQHLKERYEERLHSRTDFLETGRTLDNVNLYYQTLVRWKYIQDTLGSDALEDFLAGRGYGRIAVYGLNPLQMLLCNELKHSQSVSNAYLADSIESRQLGEYEIRRAADCSFQDVDVIIVAAFLHYDAIARNAQHAPCPILSFWDIVEELLPDSYNEHVI